MEMNKNCVFTICSKNYLAQALTLRQSFLEHNPCADFYLFLADGSNEEVDKLDIVKLDESWIPKWKEMAFKYDVIEFNTSIKPFCFNKLFNEGYEKVIYLDPDIYVVDSLSEILGWLDNYSVVLTPHINYMMVDYNGAQDDKDILGCGLYNLGFCALKNSEVGRQIVIWWMDRLEKWCYSEGPLFVDQKWMIYVPVFYPKETLLTKHAGVNTAIWNLHERTLTIEDGKYFVRDIKGETYPLLFYHFSGFDPGVPKVINRRLAHFDTDTYPSFKPIVEEYRKREYENGYDTYHPMSYAFVSFDNGIEITKYTRLLFRHFIELHPDCHEDPFSSDSSFYKLMVQKKCLIMKKSSGAAMSQAMVKKGDSLMEKRIIPGLKLLKKMFGYKVIVNIYRLSCRLCDRRVYDFLLEDK